jgi:hypothetical protein
MKPTCDQRRFPLTSYRFHSSLGDWGGYSSPYDDDDEGSEVHRFHNFSREFLLESARERAKEMVVFGFLVLVSAWPVIYMVITVTKLLWKGRAGL